MYVIQAIQTHLVRSPLPLVELISRKYIHFNPDTDLTRDSSEASDDRDSGGEGDDEDENVDLGNSLRLFFFADSIFSDCS